MLLTIDDQGIIVFVLLGEVCPFSGHSSHLLTRCQSNASLHELEHGLFGIQVQLLVLVAAKKLAFKELLHRLGENEMASWFLPSINLWLTEVPGSSRSDPEMAHYEC